MENAVATVPQQTGFVERMLTKIETLEEATKFGKFVIDSGFAPPHYKKPEQAILAIDAGMRLGFTWSQALQEGFVINGIPSYKAMAFKALVLNSGKCEKWENEWEGSIEEDNLTCITTHRRKGDLKDTIRKFGIGQARLAGLWQKNDVWKKNPEVMLESRNTARVCEKDYPDVCKGFKTTETAEDYPSMELSEDGITVSSVKIEKSKEIEKSALALNADKGTKKEKPGPAEKKAIKADSIQEAEIVKDAPKEVAPETKKSDKPAIIDGLNELPAPQLWKRLCENVSFDAAKLFDAATNKRTVNKVKALITAIHEDQLQSHLLTNYPNFTESIGTPAAENPVSESEGTPTIDLKGFNEPGENGRDMVEQVKIADLLRANKVEEDKILELYPDNFMEIDDFYKYATLEQITLALS